MADTIIESLEFKPDLGASLKRFDAWWDCEVIDRPPVLATFAKPENECLPMPGSHHAIVRDRWMDVDYIIECSVIGAANRVWYADALPVVFPNLGPEFFSALYGCPLEFGETTSWSVPILDAWTEEAVTALELSRDNVYYRTMNALTRGLVDVGQGRFIVGYTDLHGGADAIAAFRDPQALCMDMLEHSASIKTLCDRITTDFLALYDEYHAMLSAAGMPSTTWLPATCRGKYHVPSNDFSCMISDAMFQDVFLPGILRECRHMDRCIYHLDGPDALRHLDVLLDQPEIHAIQWVPGAGREDWKEWIDVYLKVQKARKAFVLTVPISEIEQLKDVLRPEGAWVILAGVDGVESADAALKSLSAWR